MATNENKSGQGQQNQPQKQPGQQPQKPGQDPQRQQGRQDQSSRSE